MELFQLLTSLLSFLAGNISSLNLKSTEKSGYYSHAVDTAMLKMQSSLGNELQHWQDEKVPSFCQKRRRHNDEDYAKSQ